MTTHVIDFDPITGVTETFRYDHATDTTYHGFHQTADALEHLVKLNKHEREHKARLGDDYLDHYARIPITVQYEWLFKYGVDFGNPDHKEKWMKMLEWPEYKVWKTTDRVHAG